MDEIPTYLVKRAQEGKLVPLIGSGVSKFVNPNKFPIWIEFLDKLVNDERVKKCFGKLVYEDLKQMISKNELLLVANKIKSDVPTDLWSTLIYEYFDDNINTNNVKIYKEIFNINDTLLITTNYDKNIEDAYAIIFGKRMDSYTHRDSSELIRLLPNLNDGNRGVLFKCHGDINRPGSIIATEQDYRQLIYDIPPYTKLFENILSWHTILSIGYGANDKEIQSKIELIRHAQSYNSMPHYMLMPKGYYNGTEKKLIRQNMGIEILEYKYTKSHNHLLPFLKEIVNAKAS